MDRRPINLTFTKSEIEVVQRIARGMKDKEIAHDLGISFGAVRKRLEGAFDRVRLQPWRRDRNKLVWMWRCQQAVITTKKKR